MSFSRLLFGSAVFLASFLLFSGEPMAAKQLLPTFGGSAAVWMTCLVFFQLVLLIGYLYAHLLTRGSGAKRQVLLHIGLLALAAIASFAWASGLIKIGHVASHPVTSIFAALSLRIGLPFLVLGTTSPLLQVWYVRVERQPVPYRLFALSNLASLLALGLYPSLIEPRITLNAQRWWWSGGVLVFAAICMVIAWCARGENVVADVVPEAAPAPTGRTTALWFLLPMVAAMQLSAITGHLTADIAAIPLLWILPLAVYLLTFVLAFELPRLYRGSLVARFLLVMLLALGYTLSQADVSFPIGIAILFFLFELLAACLFCHAELYTLRPVSPRQTTLFYLMIAAGGTTGSFLIGIASPLIFSANYDLPLSFLATALVALAVTWQQGRTSRLIWAGTATALLALVFVLHTAYEHGSLVAVRNFYGSLRVRQSVSTDGDPVRTLLNGTVQHGTQYFSPALMRTPTTYYAPDSGIGLLLLHCCEGRAKAVGVVGLGAGTLAAYANPGDRFRFYEIDPAVAPIAQNLFTYLRDAHAQISIAEGDARTSLAEESPQRFDVLVVDAFSGDAIPLHLLTTQAMAVYRRHLAPGGVLAFHVSNRFVDLQPVVASLAGAAGIEARSVASDENKPRGEFSATWVLVAEESAHVFERPEFAKAAPIKTRADAKPWTDDYSSLLPLVRW